MLYQGKTKITPILKLSNVPLQSKEVVIDSNSETTTVINPSVNYGGMSQVTVDLSWVEENLHAINYGVVEGGGGITPTGTISITENGTYDVTNYASANVSVSGGGEITLYAWEQIEGRRPMFFYSKNPTVSVGDTVICDFVNDSYDIGTPLPIGTVTNVGADVTIQVPSEGVTSRDDYYRAPSYDRTF